MSLQIEYSPRSLRDLIAMRACIIEESQSPETGDRFLSRLISATETLDSLPERFPRYPYARDWRMMPFGNYLIFSESSMTPSASATSATQQSTPRG